ncbi:histidinol-phosphate transaminase [Alphaproteobacteria bacterium]|nr:histidinol-phosphate transaminase [Alphaproteobacteria bacterium]
MAGPQPKDGVLDMPAYVGGRDAVEGWEKPFKLSSNENPLGASPLALEALKDLADPSIYPDSQTRQLREALAELNGIDASRIVCGNGSDEILHLLTQAYLQPGDEVLHTQHAFLIYKLASRATGAQPIEVAETNLCANVDALLAAVTPRTKIVFLANPNNPTGTMLDQGEITRLHAGLRDDIMLVLDGAYAEYVDPAIYPAGFDMVDAHENVVATRTFSKAYGLAGLRLGWGYGSPAIADVLNRLRGPFNINQPALQASLAALQDQEHIANSRIHNQRWRDWLVQQIGGIGLEVRSTQANFILVSFETEDRARAAEDYMCTQGVIPRGLSAYGLPCWLRLSVGTEAGNRAAVAALQSFMAEPGDE